LVTSGRHEELRLAVIAIKMMSAPTTMPPEVRPRTIQIHGCICASTYRVYNRSLAFHWHAALNLVR